MAELRTHLATERAGLGTLHLRDGAPQFYPNHHETHSILSSGAPPKELRLDCSYSQIPAFDDYLHADPEYSIDGYLS